MPLRPVDRDVLADACRSIAKDNYGFVYVDRDKEQIKSEYQSQDKSLVHADSLSVSGIKESLEELATEENTPFERIRPGVYYVDPFGFGIDMGIAPGLQQLFQSQIVTTTERLKNEFDLARDDVEFFASELRDRGLLMRIVAGNRDYYTIGSSLKDHVKGEGEDLDDRLSGKTMNGKLSHRKLEGEISVPAVSDVIDYLQNEGYVVDLDGEYLVPGSVEDFTDWLAREIETDVVDAFEDAGFVMPVSEYESLLVEEIDDRSNVLPAVRSSRGDVDERDILENVKEQFADETTQQDRIEEEDGLVIHAEWVEEEVEGHAEELVRPVLNDTTASTPSELLDEVKDDVEDLRLATTGEANTYLRERITNRAEELIDERF